MKTNHSVWWNIVGNMCLCLIIVRKLSMLKLKPWAQFKPEFLAHRRPSSTCTQCWPWENPICRDSLLFLWHPSHMFPIWSTKLAFYAWNGAEHNSALDGMWSTETRPDGTTSDRLSGQSKTLLTESQLIGDSRPYSTTHFFPACRDRAGVACTTWGLKKVS